MSDRTQRPPRTVYMTDELWNDIEQAHMQLRLAAPHTTPRSKIEFTEEVIRLGLAELRRRAHQPVPTGDDATTPRERETAAPTPQVEELSPAPAPPPTRPLPSPRRSAADRLREASNPGRPARIQSAAGGSGSEQEHPVDGA
jgi:hypothetical protein